MTVHCRTGNKLLEMVLSIPSPDFTLHHTARAEDRAVRNQSANLVPILKADFVTTRKHITKTQYRYKCDLYRRIRSYNTKRAAGDNIFWDPYEVYMTNMTLEGH